MTIAVGTNIGPYEITFALGAGGMGEVYRARDSRLNREVAIKILPASFSSDPDRLRRFEGEARAIAALSHPNILAIFDTGSYENSPYLVSELLEGQTLRERISTGALPPRKAVEYALQVAQGLAAAHEKGIVHRDLKPDNLFITKDGRVKILDFGLAKLIRPEASHISGTHTLGGVDSSVTSPGMVIGTIGYISPEQVRGQSADHRSDIFSFGAILYEMLSGQRAFKHDSAPETLAAILK
jgi:serine/threonine protein kinase